MAKKKVKIYLNENTRKLLILQAFKLYQMEAWTIELFGNLENDKNFKKLIDKVGVMPEVNSIQALVDVVQIVDVEFYHKVKGNSPVEFVGLVYTYLTGKQLRKEAEKGDPIEVEVPALEKVEGKKKPRSKKKSVTKDSDNNDVST